MLLLTVFLLAPPFSPLSSPFWRLFCAACSRWQGRPAAARTGAAPIVAAVSMLQDTGAMRNTEPFDGCTAPLRFKISCIGPPASSDFQRLHTASPQQSSSMALKEAIDVQKETLQSIERTERIINSAEDLGILSRQQLAEDNVIIEIIDSSLVKNESILRRARRDIYWFRMQLQRDKVFLFLFALVILLSVGAIVVSILYKKKQ